MARTVTARRHTLRTITFVAVLMASAVLAHVLAGGMAPGPTVVAGCAGALLVPAWALSGRERPAAVTAAAALVGQIGLHLTFCLAMPGGRPLTSVLCGRPAQSMGRAPGLMRMHAATAGTGSTSHQMLLMMLAHTVAGVVVLLGCRSLEAAVVAIVGALTACLARVVPALSVPAVRGLRGDGVVLPVHRAPLLRLSPRRGPPVCVCC